MQCGSFFPRCMLTTRAHTCQLGQTVNFQAPSFILARVEQEAIDLVERQQIENAENSFLCLKIAAHVHVQATESKTRSVCDICKRQGNKCAFFLVSIQWN